MRLGPGRSRRMEFRRVFRPESSFNRAVKETVSGSDRSDFIKKFNPTSVFVISGGVE